MRTIFGVSHETLLAVAVALALLVALGLAWAAVRNPLLPRLAWRNVPRRPGFAALITLGLTLGTVILSSAFTTGDTMSQSIRSVVTGVLGTADEVVFIPAPTQRSGFDLAQAIASGSLLTGVTSFFPQAEAERVQEVLRDDEHVAAVIPAIVEQMPVAAAAGGFGARLNLVGIPPQHESSFTSLRSLDDEPLSLTDLAADEAFVNREVSAALGVSAGDVVRVLGLPTGDVELRVRDVSRLGDLGGGQASVFLPLDRLQELLQRPSQVNQVLVVNRGGSAERLESAWPVTVRLRAAFLDDTTAERLYRALSSSGARTALRRAETDPMAGRLRDKVQRLQRALDAGAPTAEFEALAQDPEILGRLASRLPGVVNRGTNPFGATLAGPPTFRVVDVQSVAQDQAERWGSAFTDVFIVLGSFSLFSGVLLIVLVFSLVALERRSELGITRALGGRRRDVVLLLALEGGLYSLLSSAFGLAGGIALALVIIGLAQGLVQQYGFRLEPAIDPASIAASYALGVVLTFVAVTATAWRSSRFSIVTAIRDLPDPAPGPPGIRSLLLALLPLVAGGVLIRLGIDGRLSLPYAAGVALGIVGVALVAAWAVRRAGWPGPERVVFTLAGLALVGWWSVPADWLRVARLPVFPPVVEMSFLSGVGMLLGCVWVIAFNVGFLRRVRGSTPLWRLSTAYVASNRFRTGMTLAMFGLVVLSLTLSAVMLTATREAYADPSAQTGGWDIRADSNASPRDLATEIVASDVLPAEAFLAVGSASQVRVEAIQIGSAEARWQPANVLVADPGMLQAARPEVSAISAQDGRSAWAALGTRPGAAIMGAGLLRRGTAGSSGAGSVASGGVSPGWVSAAEGRDFQPVTLWLRDLRATRPAVRVEVVGLLDERGPFGNSIVVGEGTLAGWSTPERAAYYFAVPPDANARELAAGIMLAAPDLTASVIGEELRLVQGVRGLLNLILQGFMGVGLLAGVAALGTLSTRAVVERRRQIGILRSLGLTSRAIGVGLLVESALVALLGAALGVGVGLLVAQGTLAFLARQSPELRFHVPWDQVGLVVLVAVGAALLMTAIPARQASLLSPAEALRES